AVRLLAPLPAAIAIVPIARHRDLARAFELGEEIGTAAVARLRWGPGALLGRRGARRVRGRQAPCCRSRRWRRRRLRGRGRCESRRNRGRLGRRLRRPARAAPGGIVGGRRLAEAGGEPDGPDPRGGEAPKLLRGHLVEELV